MTPIVTPAMTLEQAMRALKLGGMATSWHTIEYQTNEQFGKRTLLTLFAGAFRD